MDGTGIIAKESYQKQHCKLVSSKDEIHWLAVRHHSVLETPDFVERFASGYFARQERQKRPITDAYRLRSLSPTAFSPPRRCVRGHLGALFPSGH